MRWGEGGEACEEGGRRESRMNERGDSRGKGMGGEGRE